MDRITTEQLNEILTKHAEWVNSCGAKGVRANLSGANLGCADLRDADLRDVNLWNADLRYADLKGTDLRGANLWACDLSGADLRGANLRRADLRGANLWYADLRDVNLRIANLWSANLSGANMKSANLSGANFWNADLSGANLSDAYLKGACLWYADLSGANLWDAKIDFPIACSEKGSFIAFKKVKDDYIVELLIPEDARRCSATSNKCRCDKAKVLSITKLDGTSDGVDTVYSKYDETFVYKIGEIVEVKDFDDNRWNECSTGIHFFLTRQEAVEY